MNDRLTRKSLLKAVSCLCRKDKQLAHIVNDIGPPPLWLRRPGYSTLVKLILEQQVSLASARAIYNRLSEYLGEVSARRISAVSEKDIHVCGVTRQKSRYIRDLALSLSRGEVNLAGIHQSDDQDALAKLVEIRGIGPWTADIYLLSAMARPDVWPRGDLALAESLRRIKSLRQRPSVDRQLQLTANWQPWRSVAARILWHGYLSRQRQRAVS